MKNKVANPYRTIINGMWALGSTQVMTLAVNLVKGKLVALILGPAGMGFMALFNSVFILFQRTGPLGVDRTLVRETAENRETTPSPSSRANMKGGLEVVRILASCSALLCALGSPLLSLVTFGDFSQWKSFLLLSVAVWFGVDSCGPLAVAQGLGEVGLVAKASLTGACSGLLLGVPCYLIFGTSGIVPAICIVSFAVWVCYGRALNRAVGKVSPGFLPSGRRTAMWRLVGLGIMLVASDFGLTAVQYVLNVFLRLSEGETAVGLWQASAAVTTQIGSVALAALSADYFPRLVKSFSAPEGPSATIGRQIETTLLATIPLSCLIVLFAPLAVKLFLSASFLGAVPLVQWLCVALVLRAWMLPLGYVTLAKGNRRLYFWMEAVGANLLTMALLIGGYLLWGLTGLGVAMAADNFVCGTAYIAVNRRLYSLPVKSGAVPLAGAGVLMTLTVLFSSRLAAPWGWVLAVATTLAAVAVSAFLLRARFISTTRED